MTCIGLGTALYMAPELLDDPNGDAAADRDRAAADDRGRGAHVAFNSLANTGLGLTLAIFVVRLPEELMRARSRNG